MPRPTAIIFDIGRVLYQWDPRFLYQRLIPEGEALDAFLRDVLTLDWHYQHDQGRAFADTSRELIAAYPQHEALIAAWGPRFLESIPGPVEGMPALVAELDAAGVPLWALTNFSHEFWPAFRAQEAALFDRFRGVLVSGEEKMVKPDPAIFRLALDRFGLDAATTVFVDDSPANIAGATAAGLTAFLFTDAGALRRDLAGVGLIGG